LLTSPRDIRFADGSELVALLARIVSVALLSTGMYIVIRYFTPTL